MRWTCVVTHFHYWMLGKNVDLSGSPSGCARRTPLAVVAFGVLSVWWKTSAFVSTLFWVVLPHLVPTERASPVGWLQSALSAPVGEER